MIEVADSLPGLTLRDYFAAHALTGLLSTHAGIATKWGKIAEDAYDAADIMMFEREKREKQRIENAKNGKDKTS